MTSSLITFVYNDVNFVIKLINLTCNIEPKIHSVGIMLCFDSGVRVNVSWLVNEKLIKSPTWKIDIDVKTDSVVSGLILTLVFEEPWVPDWVASYKTDTWE